MCGRVPDLQSGGCGFESHPGLLRTKLYSAFHPSGVGKWVPAAVGKAKAGMAHSDCGWTCGCAGKTVKSWNPMRTRAIPERFCGSDSLRRGAIWSVCIFTFTFLYLLRCYFVICVFCLLVVIVRLSVPVQVTSLERLVSEMTCNMLTGTLSPTQSLVHFQMFINDNILRCSDVLCTVARRLNIHTSTWSSSTTSVSPVTVTFVRTSSRSATIPAWLSPALGQQSHWYIHLYSPQSVAKQK